MFQLRWTGFRSISRRPFMAYVRYFVYLCVLSFGTFLLSLFLLTEDTRIHKFLPDPLLDLFSFDSEIDFFDEPIDNDANTSNMTFQLRIGDYYPRFPIHIATQNVTARRNRSKLILLGNGLFNDATWGIASPGKTSAHISKEERIFPCSYSNQILFWTFSAAIILSLPCWLLSSNDEHQSFLASRRCCLSWARSNRSEMGEAKTPATTTLCIRSLGITCVHTEFTLLQAILQLDNDLPMDVRYSCLVLLGKCLYPSIEWLLSSTVASECSVDNDRSSTVGCGLGEEETWHCWGIDFELHRLESPSEDHSVPQAWNWCDSLWKVWWTVSPERRLSKVHCWKLLLLSQFREQFVHRLHE